MVQHKQQKNLSRPIRDFYWTITIESFIYLNFCFYSMMKLKTSMLLSILHNQDTPNKYSKSFLNIKNVIDLEKDEIKQIYIDEFLEIEKKYNSLINEVPVNVIEKYVQFTRADLNALCYILYKGNEISEYTTIELFNELEKFYSDIFFLASKIADYYNLEVKLNKDGQDNIDKI